MSEQPNILLVMADQLAPHFTGTYGHPIVQTPHLDALAKRGVRFDAAYAASPLCAPARFAMMSGQDITRIGAYDNAAEFSAATPTFAHYLGLMGYRTCLSGKMHFVGPDQLHGFDERLTTDIYPADFAWTPDWEWPDQRIDKWYHNMDSLREAGQAAMTYQLEFDEEVGHTTQRKLFDYARDDDDRPWMLTASFIHPHDPYVARPEWWDRYDHSAIDLPLPIEVDSLDPHSGRIRAGIEYDSDSVAEEHIRNARHAYYANVSYFDSWLGRLVEVLRETNQLDNTVVVVTADHGDMLGERWQWFKMSFFERSVRIPLVMSGPGVEHRSVGNACSHTDLLPTLLDIAGGLETERPSLGQPLDGRSLWPLATGGDDEVDVAYSVYCAEMTSHPMFMIRRGPLKYIHCDSDPPLLYDVVVDPEETNNLVDHPDRASEAAAFAVEVADRWDANGIRQQVLDSQLTRRAVYQAMRGRGTSWDYQPRRDAADQYVRDHIDWAEAGAKTRFRASTISATRECRVGSVKLGVDIPNYGPFGDPRLIAEFARDIEDAGWDGLSLWDHLYIHPGNEVADPWVALSAVAAITDRISLQMLVTPTPRRRPWKLARECVSLDQLSDGRFVLGVGIGNPPHEEFGIFGDVADDRIRGQMLDEGLDVLCGLWSGKTFSYDGEHYHIGEVQFLPKPVQQPRIPIWVAGVWPRRKPFRRAAKWDGVAPIAIDERGEFRNVTPQDVKDIRAYIDEHRGSDDPYDVAMVGGLPNDAAEASDLLAQYEDAGVTWWRTSWAPWGDLPFDEWLVATREGPPSRA